MRGRLRDKFGTTPCVIDLTGFTSRSSAPDSSLIPANTFPREINYGLSVESRSVLRIRLYQVDQNDLSLIWRQTLPLMNR